MSYSYEKERPYVFTDEGSRKVLQLLNVARAAIKIAGAVRAGRLMDALSGDSFQSMACVERLVEVGELREIPTSGVWQNKVFVDGRE